MRLASLLPVHHMAQIKASPDLILVARSLLIDWNPTGALTPFCPHVGYFGVSNLRNTNFPPPQVNSKLITGMDIRALKNIFLVLHIFYFNSFFLDKINFQKREDKTHSIL